MVYVLVSAFILTALVLIYYVASWYKWKRIKNVKRALFVISHPDDECMFFGPSIVSLCSEGAEVYLLCLSAGNHKKKGRKRKKELRESCSALGINISNITVIEHTFMQDDPRRLWQPELVAKLICKYVESYDVDTLITFDRYGISGHKNHSSLYYGVQYLRKHDYLPPGCRVFVLVSVNILRKYSGIMDALWSLLLSKHLYLLNMQQRCQVQRAMASHKSQLVWFRRLYMFFSRYPYMNSLHQLPQVNHKDKKR